MNMKLIKYGFGLLLSVLLFSCGSNKWWEDYKLTNEDVTWESAGETFSLNTQETPIVISIQRGVATEALSVPITLVDEHNVYTINTSKVDFAAGEYVKSITLTYKYADLVPGTEYIFTLKLPESLAGAGCFYKYAGNGMMALEYEDYKEMEYELFYSVNTTSMSWNIRAGSLNEDFDATTVKLMRAKGTNCYYKVCLYGDENGFTEFEFKNNGDGSITFAKYAGYNENVKVDSQGRACLTKELAIGDTYDFTVRQDYWYNYGAAETGPEIMSGDEFEIYSWIKKNGSSWPNSYNTYQILYVD